MIKELFEKCRDLINSHDSAVPKGNISRMKSIDVNTIVNEMSSDKDYYLVISLPSSSTNCPEDAKKLLLRTICSQKGGDNYYDGYTYYKNKYLELKSKINSK